MSVSKRQHELLTIMAAYTEPQPATVLARIMRYKHGLKNPSQIYDLLGVLREKGLVRLVEDDWALTDAGRGMIS